MRVETGTFEFAHGRRPRGRGNWAFELVRENCHTLTVWHMGTYSEAKREAVRQAKECGASYVVVLS